MICRITSLLGTSSPHWYKITHQKNIQRNASAVALAFLCSNTINQKMPTYVYKCNDNGHVFDLIQKFNDEPGANCPTCGSESRRQITSPTVIYKGSGFYTTDYGSGSNSNNQSQKDDTSKTSSSSESKSKNSSSSSSSESESAKSSSSTSAKSKSQGTSGSNSSHSHGAGGHTH